MAEGGSTLRAPEWEGDREVAWRREMRVWVLGSVAGHVLLLSLFAVSPAPAASPLPPVLSVDLVAALPSPPKPRPAPKKVLPAPAAKPKPPPPPAAKRVLPKKAPKAIKKPSKPARPRRERPRELDYEEALNRLRAEAGEKPPEPQAAPTESASEEESSGTPGVTDAEIAAWVLATIRHVKSVYVTPPEFLTQSLMTDLQVTLTSTGEVVGTPAVIRSSGNPFWDDNAVRALVRASPLPPPPEPGVIRFAFPSQASR